ncbi:YFL012W-like protein [Saccharomyces cerevisiae x Saccharomyces kudriavzevii VIN7]|uniref:YFL012W-like protein n=1 Tax=Saccharomyces cerevisiae x Saccharomyces kudriavzevii (strain VIN7) TaxID=1095631 RepID=H0GUA1_SACCK|nr:YFL012W-like protein [Saccharomyces cerevisiae x Saccharomyces kudriavzevii VIN7]CAI5265560.1 AIS_HP2_G0016070.mRNA.1.CDS.1 [Saccharomyces cerevisiae]CAI6487282.1 AIS_HP2_G0016070.mRNA.1.CDS.1 [Saccharomyces cerevisiae]
MSKRRPKRSIAPSSPDFYESLQFQNDGYIKVRELVSHVVIEKNIVLNTTMNKTMVQHTPEPMANGAAYKLTRWKKRINCISKDLANNEVKTRKRDRVLEWLRRNLLKEDIEILSHKKKSSSIDSHFWPSQVVVGCSRELSKPASPQILKDAEFSAKENVVERRFNISSCPVKRNFNTLVFEVDGDGGTYYSSLRDSYKNTIKRPINPSSSQFFVGKQHRTNF